MLRTVAFLVSALLVGCDPMWVRQSVVAPTHALFPQCVADAVSPLPELEIAQEHSSSSSVFLRAKKFVIVSVTALPDGTLQLEARGGGFSPSSEQEAYTTPLLARLTTRLAEEC